MNSLRFAINTEISEAKGTLDHKLKLECLYVEAYGIASNSLIGYMLPQ